jgi:gas vesicle protein
MVNDEHENDANGPGGFGVGMLTGTLIGGLAGATAMLLLAPQSGKRTRAKLQRQSHELREQAADTVEDAVDQARGAARQITHDVRKQAEELEQRGQKMLDGQKGR